MTDSEKVIPERYTVEYRDVCTEPVPSTSWEWETERFKSMLSFAKKLIEELGAAEAKLAEFDISDDDPMLQIFVRSGTFNRDNPETTEARQGGTIGDWMRRAHAVEASLAASAAQQEAMRAALEKTSKFHRLDCSYMRDQRCQHCDCGKWEAEEVLAALSPQEPKQDYMQEPVKFSGKHRFMAGTCVDCGKPLSPVCIPFGDAQEKGGKA